MAGPGGSVASQDPAFLTVAADGSVIFAIGGGGVAGCVPPGEKISGNSFGADQTYSCFVPELGTTCTIQRSLRGEFFNNGATVRISQSGTISCIGFPIVSFTSSFEGQKVANRALSEQGEAEQRAAHIDNLKRAMGI